MPGARVVVIGAGWIGCEVAATAKQRGAEVTIVAPEEVPLERVLGPEVGAIYRDVHASHGVELVLGTGIEAFEGPGSVDRRADERRADARGRPGRDGRRRGAAHRARRGGRPRGRRRRPLDDRLRTSAPNVFAAGDIATRAAPDPRRARPRRALGHRARAGPGRGAQHARPRPRLRPHPVFFSDQYDVGMEYAGWADLRPVVFRGDPASFEFLAFWMRGERVAAG